MVAINLDDVANGVYSRDDEGVTTESSYLTTFTLAPDFVKKPVEYADGQTFPSVVAPLTSYWSLLPLIVIAVMIVFWMLSKLIRCDDAQLKREQNEIPPQIEIETVSREGILAGAAIDPGPHENSDAIRL